MEKYKQVLEDSLGDIFTSAIQMLPKIILGILGLIIAWILVKIILFVLKRILRAAKVDQLSKKVTDAKLFGDNEVKVDLIKVFLGITRILLILLFALLAALLSNSAILKASSSDCSAFRRGSQCV